MSQEKLAEQLQTERDHLKLLLDVNAAVVSSLDLKELVRATATFLGRHLRFDYMSLALHDPATDTMQSYALQFEQGRGHMREGLRAPLDGTPAGWALRNKRPFIGHTSADLQPFKSELVQKLIAEGIHSGVCCPLLACDRVLGTLNMLAFRERAFSPADVALLGEVAGQIAPAVANAGAYSEVKELKDQLSGERDRLRLLLDVNAAVVSHLALPALLEAIAACLRRFVRFEYTSFALHEPGLDGLRLYALEGVGRDIGITGTVSPLTGSPAGVAFRTGSPEVAHTEAELRAFENPRLDLVIEAGVKSMASAPMLVNRKPIGCVTAGSLRERAFAAPEVELLAQVANQLAPAVSNALAFLEIERLKDKLAREKSYLEAELRHEFREIVGQSPALAQVLEAVETVAPTDATVLIQGETGTARSSSPARSTRRRGGRRGPSSS